MLYVHIPFCKSRCTYCGFYSTTALWLQRRYADALCREHMLRCGNAAAPPTTVYIGGGTPSTLPPALLGQLFDTIGGAAEVTIECNPDDVTPDFCASLRHTPVNRVSMGAQTFSDERLRFIGRRHTSRQVAGAVDNLRRAGIGNISIDIMYGFPGETLADWLSDIDSALALGVEHLSAYALTVEEGTALQRQLARGVVRAADEELSRTMYYALLDRAGAAGYEHYEISNFARPGYRSRHNSGYWNHTPYTGLGAAAHSFDGRRRQWNVADIVKYMEGVESGHMDTCGETLSDDSLYNEKVMTALRTCEGLPLGAVTEGQRSYCLGMARRYIDGGLLCHDTHSDRLRLTRQGLFVSDMVIADLMIA